MTTLTFAPAASELTVETKAVGMLAKLAHDLSIVANEVDAAAVVSGDQLEVKVRVPVARLSVRGVRKGGTVDESVLSASDRAEIQRRLREEVIKPAEVVATLTVPASSIAEPGKRTAAAKGTVEIGARRASVTGNMALDVTDARATAEGRVRVNMPSLGITPPKGPLGAFKVHEDVEIVVRLVFERG